MLKFILLALLLPLASSLAATPDEALAAALLKTVKDQGWQPLVTAPPVIPPIATPPPVTTVPPPTGATLANVLATSPNWTMGHSFPKAAVPAGKGLACGTLPLQIDQRADWPDGSLRFGVLSAVAAPPLCSLTLTAPPGPGGLAPIAGPVVTVELDVFEPQRTRISAGRFAATGSPNNAGFAVGNAITLDLAGDIFTHTVVAAEAGITEQALTALTNAMMAEINASGRWHATKNYQSQYHRFLVERADAKPEPFAVAITTTSSTGPVGHETMNAAQPPVRWTASSTGMPTGTWLDGPLVREAWVAAPFTDATGVVHPHLTARFGARQYGKMAPSRHQVVMENTKTWAPGPRNYTYDVRVKVGATVVLDEDARVHLHHARWSRAFGDPGLPQRDWQYLRASDAVLNYAATGISETTLNYMSGLHLASDTSVTGHAMIQRGMPTAGGRWDIGPLTGWAAMAIMSSGDPRAIAMTMALAYGGMTAPHHYRDERTGQPVSIDSYPTMTLHPASVPALADKLPVLDLLTSGNRWSIDNPHQPSLFYLPYLLTGDTVWLEQLHFWLVGNCLIRPSGSIYRDRANCLILGDEERGYAWYMRTVGHALAVAPAGHPLRTLAANTWNRNVAALETRWWGTAASPVGTPAEGVFPRYLGVKGSTAPWMADMNVYTFGLAAMQELPRAREIVKRGAKFAAGRFSHEADGWCRIEGGGIYYAKLHDRTTFAALPTWPALVAANPDAQGKLIDGRRVCSTVLPFISPGHYPIMARASLSIMADLGIAEAVTALAWHKLAASNTGTDRVVAIYRQDPTFAIVARSK